MKTQNLSNHVRVHPLYHYVAVPLSLVLIPASIINLFFILDLTSVMLLMSMLLLHLSIFFARDYAKKNQDRIIRMELRLRYYLLTNQRLEELEGQFTTAQLLALRFCSDEEFMDMVSNPTTKTKTPIQIKQSIIQWEADWMRV